MNVQSDDVRKRWVEGPSYRGDNTFTELFTQKILSKLLFSQNYILKNRRKNNQTFQTPPFALCEKLSNFSSFFSFIISKSTL